MSQADKILLAQCAALKASLDAAGAQVSAFMQTLQLLEATTARPEAPKGPRCPKCGSPKHHDLSDETEAVYQCADCYEKYNPGEPVERANP